MHKGRANILLCSIRSFYICNIVDAHFRFCLRGKKMVTKMRKVVFLSFSSPGGREHAVRVILKLGLGHHSTEMMKEKKSYKTRSGIIYTSLKEWHIVRICNCQFQVARWDLLIHY